MNTLRTVPRLVLIATLGLMACLQGMEQEDNLSSLKEQVKEANETFNLESLSQTITALTELVQNDRLQVHELRELIIFLADQITYSETHPLPYSECYKRCDGNCEDPCPSRTNILSMSSDNETQDESFPSRPQYTFADKLDFAHATISFSKGCFACMAFVAKSLFSGCIAFYSTGSDYLHNRCLFTAPHWMCALIRNSIMKLKDNNIEEQCLDEVVDQLRQRARGSATLTALLKESFLAEAQSKKLN